MWQHIVTICHVYADVGPWWPDSFPHHRLRGRGEGIMGVDVERTFQSNHTNFVRLTHRVPMAQVEDLPEAMQSRVVGVPWAWVWLFRWLAIAVVCDHNQNLPPPPQAWRLESDSFLYYRVLYFGGSKAPFCIMTLMDYDVTFWMFNEKLLWWSILFIYMCKKCMFLICLWSMKQIPI